MFINTDSIYRVTVPGTADVEGESEFFTLGRTVDGAHYDLAALRKAGIGLTLQFPPLAPPAPAPRPETRTSPRPPRTPAPTPE